MDSNKQGSKETGLGNVSNLFSDFIRERDLRAALPTCDPKETVGQDAAAQVPT
jgi:hypothetical protein